MVVVLGNLGGDPRPSVLSLRLGSPIQDSTAHPLAMGRGLENVA